LTRNFKFAIVARMTSWSAFKELQPDLAEQGADLLYHFGVGLAFLSTVRRDGGPRVHPMCPLLSADGLYAFIIPSPKQRDLHRDGRYAMHSFPMEDNEDAFSITGHAHAVSDVAVRASLARQFVEERTRFAVPDPASDHDLFGFDIDAALLTRTASHGDSSPQHTIWHAPQADVTEGRTRACQVEL
jgi:hypothetical protein